MNASESSGMKFWYDGADGVPVDITAQVMTINDIEVKNVLVQDDGFGTKMPAFIPSGRGTFSSIQLGGIYKTGSGSIDALFADRVPEDASTPTRTFTIQYLTGRTQSVETHLDGFKRSANKDNGITKYTVTLQPSGEIDGLEVIP